MAIKIVGASNNHAQVDSDLAAALLTVRPDQVLNYQSTSGVSGSMTQVVANGPVWSFRNTGLYPILVRRVAVSFRLNVGYTAGQAMRFAVFRAIGFTASDSGGTALYTVLQNRQRTNLTPVSSAPDIRICATAALTAGTRTLETIPLGAVQGYIAAATAGLVISPTEIISQDAGHYPVVLAQNEGLVLVNQVLMGAPAGAIGNLIVQVEWAEAQSY